MKIQTATDGEVLIAATVCRAETPGGMLLFGYGCVDGTQQGSPSTETESAVSIGVDSISSALRLLDQERGESGGPALLAGPLNEASNGGGAGSGADAGAAAAGPAATAATVTATAAVAASSVLGGTAADAEDVDEWTRALGGDPSVLASQDPLVFGSGSHGSQASVPGAGRGAGGAPTRGDREGVGGGGSGGGSASAGTGGENGGSSVGPGARTTYSPPTVLFRD